MFVKTFTAALALLALAGAAIVSPTEASAANGRNGKAVVGAIVGLTGALIAGSVVANHRGGYLKADYRGHGFRGHGHRGERYGYGHGFRQRDCFEKPVTRWSRFHGEHVIVGHRKVCR